MPCNETWRRSVLIVTAFALCLLGLSGCTSLPPVPPACPQMVGPPPDVMAPLPEPLHQRQRLDRILDAASTTSSTTGTVEKPN